MAQKISAQQARALAQAGDANAQYALSAALHQAGKYDESLHWLRLAAASRLVPAQLALAALLVDGRGCARDVAQARALLEPLAATQPRANRLLAELHGFAAFGVGDRETGLRYLAAAAQLGDAGARRQLELAAEIPLPEPETLCESPVIRKYSGVIPQPVTDALIALAAPLVQRSQIIDARTGERRADPMRTSSHVTIGPRQHDHALEAIARCIARITGVPASHGEFTQILRYRSGEEFKPHVDYFNVTDHPELVAGGQRAQTVLIYLNDGYSGGATEFPKLQLAVHGRRGDVLHFHNLDVDGAGHRDSLHAGTPVTSGEKWLLSQWIRSEPHPPRVAW